MLTQSLRRQSVMSQGGVYFTPVAKMSSRIYYKDQRRKYPSGIIRQCLPLKSVSPHGSALTEDRRLRAPRVHPRPVMSNLRVDQKPAPPVCNVDSVLTKRVLSHDQNAVHPEGENAGTYSGFPLASL